MDEPEEVGDSVAQHMKAALRAGSWVTGSFGEEEEGLRGEALGKTSAALLSGYQGEGLLADLGDDLHDAHMDAAAEAVEGFAEFQQGDGCSLALAEDPVEVVMRQCCSIVVQVDHL
jgi:hypothetical protein